MKKVNSFLLNIFCNSSCHIVKRDDVVWWKAWIIRIISVILALLVCGVITVSLTKLNPIKMYMTMIDGAIGSPRLVWNMLQNTAILLCISLAVTPAFKMKFWNIGAEGQVLIGGLATATCMIFLGGKLSTPLLILVMFAVSIISGALWGLIPALFKVRFNSNETLFTLMMNYIAIQIVAYFTLEWSVPKGSGTPRTLEFGQLPTILGQKYLINILLVVLITVIMYIYLKYSKQGYEISVVGVVLRLSAILREKLTLVVDGIGGYQNTVLSRGVGTHVTTRCGLKDRTGPGVTSAVGSGIFIIPGIVIEE